MARIVVAQSDTPELEPPIPVDFQFTDVGDGSVDADAQAFEPQPAHVIHESDFELPSNTPLAPRQHALLSYPFSHFNRIQSAIHPWAATDVNLVVAAATSTGKTIDGELFMAESIWAGYKALYMPPLRAVASEKYQDWTTKNSSFGAYAMNGSLNVSICTGDYNLTPSRKAELDRSHIIVMTPEMLDSRSRRHHHEGNTWLTQIRTLVADELHLIGMNERGHRLESALMRFTRKNPDCRIVGLSATMPNVKEVAEWLTKLNGKRTVILDSKWRPTQLNIHYEKVHLASDHYNGRLKALTSYAGWIVTQHPNDQILIFVHTKKHGSQIVKDLQGRGVPCQFHYSDLTARERHHIEQMFKNGEYRVIVSTSTLAWGVNLPARRGIICGTIRGLNNEVHAYDIAQMCGRCGRVGYDEVGDAHILIPDDKYEIEQRRVDLSALPPIQSKIRNRRLKAEQDATLAFHLVSEYHRKQGGKVSSEAARKWFDRTLASHQGGSMDSDEAQSVCDNLYELGIFDRQLAENGRPRYSVTGLGKVADYIYLSPFDVADYYQNFKRLFQLDESKWEDAAAIAYCLTQIHTYDVQQPYLPTDKDKYGFQKQMYKNDMSKLKGFTAGDVKTVTVYYYLLAKGMRSEIPPEARGILANVRLDLDRIFTACELIDRIHAHWGRSRFYWRKLAARILYGVDETQSELCCVRHVGAAKCELLFKVGVTSLEDMVDPAHRLRIESVLKSKATESITHAEQLLKSEKKTWNK